MDHNLRFGLIKNGLSVGTKNSETIKPTYMKTRILLFISIFCLTLSYGQKKLNDYHLEIYSEAYDIMATEPEKEKYSYYLSVPPAKDTRQVALIIKNDELPDFRSKLQEAKKVYLEWKKTAIENNVNDVDKEIEIGKLRLSTGFVYGRDWNFDFSVNIGARFRVIDDKHLLIIENKEKLQASDNRYIDSSGFILAFSSEEEVDDLLSKLTAQAVEEYFSEQQSTEDIFKQ